MIILNEQPLSIQQEKERQNGAEIMELMNLIATTQMQQEMQMMEMMNLIAMMGGGAA